MSNVTVLCAVGDGGGRRPRSCGLLRIACRGLSRACATIRWTEAEDVSHS